MTTLWQQLIAIDPAAPPGTPPHVKWVASRVPSSLTDEDRLWLAHQNRTHDVYYSTGAFNTRERNARFCVSHDTLFLDVDAAKATPDRSVTDACGTALHLLNQGGLAALGLPEPSLVVTTGGGLHLYWQFTAPVHADQWQALADALKARQTALNDSWRQQLNLMVNLLDPTVTSDRARIMRLPGFRNVKRDAMCATVASSDPYDYVTLANALGVIPGARSALPAKKVSSP